MIVTVRDFMHKRAGTVPMIGRQRLRAEYFVWSLAELKERRMMPCVLPGTGVPALCTDDEIVKGDSDVLPASWGEFLQFAAYDLQVGIHAGWAFKVGDNLVVARDVADSEQIAVGAQRGTRREALQWLRELTKETIEQEGEIER